MNMTIRQKATLFFLAIIGAMTVSTIVVLGLFNIVMDDAKQAQEKIYHLAAEEIPFLKVSKELKADVIQVQQWLTDISATRGLDGLNDGFEVAAEYAVKFADNIAEAKDLAKKTGNPKILATVNKMEQEFTPYYEYGQVMAKAYVDGGPAEGNKLMETFDGKAAAVNESADHLVELVTDHTQKEMDEGTAILDETVMFSTWALYAVLILGGIALPTFFLIALYLRSVVNKEIGSLQNSLIEINEHLQSSSTQANGIAQELSAVSKQTSTQSGAALASSASVNSNVDSVAGSVNELSSSVHGITQSIGQAVNAVREATKGTQDASSVLQELEQASSRINSVVGFINELSEQTNLLALNAAIEAARAGDAGRGFAVVADEVRKLATQTSKATEEISQEVNSVTDASSRSVSTLQGIIKHIEQVNAQMDTVSISIKEQSEATDDISNSIQDIVTNISGVHRNVSDVETAASHTGDAANKMLNVSSVVKNEVDTLGSALNSFLQRI